MWAFMSFSVESFYVLLKFHGLLTVLLAFTCQYLTFLRCWFSPHGGWRKVWEGSKVAPPLIFLLFDPRVQTIAASCFPMAYRSQLLYCWQPDLWKLFPQTPDPRFPHWSPLHLHSHFPHSLAGWCHSPAPCAWSLLHCSSEQHPTQLWGVWGVRGWRTGLRHGRLAPCVESSSEIHSSGSWVWVKYRHRPQKAWYKAAPEAGWSGPGSMKTSLGQRQRRGTPTGPPHSPTEENWGHTKTFKH